MRGLLLTIIMLLASCVTMKPFTFDVDKCYTDSVGDAYMQVLECQPAEGTEACLVVVVDNAQTQAFPVVLDKSKVLKLAKEKGLKEIPCPALPESQPTDENIDPGSVIVPENE